VGDGGMNYGDFEEKLSFVETKQFRALFWTSVVLFVVFMLFYIWYRTPSFVNPKIQAEEYVWPMGCEAKTYELTDQISKKCMQEKYYIGEGWEYGWPRGGKSRPAYYRVGNDALDFRACDQSVEGFCDIHNRIVKVYITNRGL
jgi:hypothetical protein